MDKELDDELVRKYPKIFADRHKPPQATAMCWGFECGNGWYHIIDDMCDKIQKHIDSLGDPNKQVVATQVKEKFGGLRFYYRGGDDVTDKIVEDAESLSYLTCEDCGTQEDIGRTTGYIRTLCRECAEFNGLIERWKPIKFEE